MLVQKHFGNTFIPEISSLNINVILNRDSIGYNSQPSRKLRDLDLCPTNDFSKYKLLFSHSFPLFHNKLPSSLLPEELIFCSVTLNDAH